MMTVDLSKSGTAWANTSISKVGMTDLSGLSFLSIFNGLDLGLAIDSKRQTPNFPTRSKVDISPNIKELRQSKKIADVIGSTKIRQKTRVYFSTLISLEIKSYLHYYVEIARHLCNDETGLCFTVWLEDTFTAIKNSWDKDTLCEALKNYQTFFAAEFPNAQLLVSSEVISFGIPRDFAEERFSSISSEEFLSLIPFHLRKPMFIKIIDVIHFAWNCYVIYCYPGLYLTGVSTKRHFELFRKVLGKQISCILVPMLDED